jgi:hypothetical protein
MGIARFFKDLFAPAPPPPTPTPPMLTPQPSHELTVGFGSDGSTRIGWGGAHVVLNEPHSDDDERPRSRDGLEVARRLVAKLACATDLEDPAYTFIDAALLSARSGDALPHIVDSRRRMLAGLCWAAADRDSGRALAIADHDDELAYYRDALVLPFAPAAILARSPTNLRAIVVTGASDRELAARALVALAGQEVSDGLLIEATLIALDLGLDAKPLLDKWKRPHDGSDNAVRQVWRAAEVRRMARIDLDAALKLEAELPDQWDHDAPASLAVAARLARSDPARAVALATENEPDLRHMSWLQGCVHGAASVAGELVDEWIAALNPLTYDPYGYFRGLLESCLDLGDVARTRRCLEMAGATGWQVAHAARWRLGRAANREELLEACLDPYKPGLVAGRAVGRAGFPMAAGRVVIQPQWLDFSDPHPVETLSVVAALGADAPMWEWDWLP